MGSVRDFGRVVWAPDAAAGYVLATLTDIGSTELTVLTIDTKQTIKAGYDDVFPAEDDNTKVVDDNCALMYLNEGTLLNNCHLRYKGKKIYSYVANILISINPYEEISNLYSETAMNTYKGKSLGQLPPHIFAIADKAYRDMRRTKESQSIIVSGESGAGKTESQKAVLKYLCHNWGTSSNLIQKRILETNPILEAFGNAKTMRNNNSSRFGKFVEIHFGSEGAVAGGYVSHYLLEKSRICKQTEGERSYHIFYQMIAGLDLPTFKALKLSTADKFNYLRKGNTCLFGKSSNIPVDRVSNKNILHDAVVDDRRDFSRLTTALEGIGLKSEQIVTIWRTIAAVLHLGNIDFIENVDDSRGGCSVDERCESALTTAAQLIGIEAAELRVGLVSRIMQATKGGVKGTLIRVPLKPHEAAAARDALAKAIYSRMFDWLVQMINKSINNSGDGKVIASQQYIGVLDIAGFEFFVVNSFEQFCINYCNEKLQYFFNERILKQEQAMYEKEGLNVPRISYSDNHDCIDLFERKSTGLLDLLDEESRLPRASPQHYTQMARQANTGHFRIEAPRKSRLRAHREMREDDGFLIRHYAGTVCYHTQQFIDKNNDQLHHSLQFLIEQSSVPFVRSLFPMVDLPNHHKSSKKLQSVSVGSKFRSQLNVLIDKLESTGTHFIRCVKPNSTMSSSKFEGQAVLDQLKCAGMTSVLKLMQKGFPSRTGFADLYQMYQSVLPKELSLLDPRLFCKCLFRALGLNNSDFKFGLTKVFFRPGKFAEFDQMLRQDPATMQMLVNKVRSWLNRTRWRKVQYGAWSVVKLKNKILYRAEKITLLQSVIRGFVVRKAVKPRLALYRAAVRLLARTNEMTEVVSGLQTTQAANWTPIVHQSSADIGKLVHMIKNADNLDMDKIARDYERCLSQVDNIILRLKKQLEADKQAKLLRLEAKRKEEDKRQREEREKEERYEREKDTRRAMDLEREKEEQKWKEQQRRNVPPQIEAKKKSVEQLEQERLDAILAARIVQEDRRQRMMEPNTSLCSSQSSGHSTSSTKYDLSEWKYADLRDTINTSLDMELLLACKTEFHRRLQIYNEWKARNTNSRDIAPPRAPFSVFNPTNASPATSHFPASLNMQRFFKVPFSRPADVYKNPNGIVLDAGSGAQYGMWYAHFNGQWISRQIELHPNKPAVLLVAGKDDLSMCELPLDQTTLTRKKGAEILEHEFETVWTHLGGKPIPRWTP